MDYKKIFILPALFIGSTLLYIGCCQCIDSSKKFFQVNSLIVHAWGSGNAVVDTGNITTVDTLYLNYNFRGECVVKNEPDLSFLVNTARASKCDCIGCGDEGLKNKATTITITSDSVYNNIPANQPLNSFFKLNYSYSTPMPFDSAVSLINRPYGSFQGIPVFTTTKPGNDKKHVFKLTIRFADGQTLFIDTKRITWM